MRLRDPYQEPLEVLAIDDEVVFLGEGPVGFSMTPQAARSTFHNLAATLIGLRICRVDAPQPCVILVVEDEPLTREVAAAVLEDAGYKVIVAAGARAALTALEDGATVNLLFTDIQMPGGVDGIELARLVRDRWPAMPLLVTSGQETPAPAKLPPGGRFVPKPYVPADILRHVDELIAERA